MFLPPKAMTLTPMVIASDVQITIPDCPVAGYVRRCMASLGRPEASGGRVCRRITFRLGIPEEIRAEIERTRKIVGDPEEYVLSVGEESVIYASEPIGFLRAASTLMQMDASGELCESLLYDYPTCPIRGYRVYMPGRETMADFKRMIDFIVYYKFNSLILEIGGAMEYKRHPRINEKWVEFCRECSEYSDKAEDMQESQQWAKNSIHYENGDGAWLTQEECRELAAYCRERGLEIIPECPTLSHADYICLAYPELAERPDDPWPDTYCPSNPDSYKVVFDILDEVIDVFAPKKINIGHDEYYSACVCERCRGKVPSSVYAEDVRMLRDYLAAKGVETMMWGEKLLKARYRDGGKIGGWYDPRNRHGVIHQIPPMFDCADKMPKGITYLHWYWEFGEHLDDEYHAREYPVVFGNFQPRLFQNFRKRIQRGVKGAFVSNWGSNAEEYMQRNGQYLELVLAGYALWSDTYDDPQKEDVKKRAIEELFIQHNRKIQHPLRVRHCAHHAIHSKYFWCGRFIVDELFLLGHYVVTYTDGTTAQLPVKFGTNIGPVYSSVPRDYDELVYSTKPIQTPDGYMYEHLYENPYPEKTVGTVAYVPVPGKEDIRVVYVFDR